MSGITPILDTLLHEVLGKRVDGKGKEALNKPVGPTSFANALKPIMSDSRLDARPAVPWSIATGKGANAALPTNPATPASATNQPSATTTLSPTAKVIGEAMTRLSGASVLRITGQLMPPRVANADELAQRLAGSIKNSGLFYESRLLRWHLGNIPRAQLSGQPQLLQPGTAIPQGSALSYPQVPVEGVTDKAPGQPVNQRLQPPPQPGAPPANAAQPGANAAQTAANAAAAMQLPALSQAVAEQLQHLIPHQLELLVTPTMRWEGDIWAGLFAALLINAPHKVISDYHEEHEPDPEEEAQVQAELVMTLEGMGQATAKIWLKKDALRIDITCTDTTLHYRLSGARPKLIEELKTIGFIDPQVTTGLEQAPYNG